MKKDAKTYILITQGTGDNEKKYTVPEGKLKKMVEAQEDFDEINRITYEESTFENMDEWTELEADEQVKLDILNRGWASYQQVAAKNYLASPDFEPSTEPIDITSWAIAPRERKKAAPIDKNRRSMLNLQKEDPAAFAKLLEEFREAARSMGLAVEG